jgi:hypothetical protein
MAEVRAGVPPVEPEPRQQVLVEVHGRRVVALRVAAGGDRGQQQQRRPEVVDEDQQDGRQPEDVGQEGSAIQYPTPHPIPPHRGGGNCCCKTGSASWSRVLRVVGRESSGPPARVPAWPGGARGGGGKSVAVCRSSQPLRRSRARSTARRAAARSRERCSWCIASARRARQSPEPAASSQSEAAARWSPVRWARGRQPQERRHAHRVRAVAGRHPAVLLVRPLVHLRALEHPPQAIDVPRVLGPRLVDPVAGQDRERGQREHVHAVVLQHRDQGPRVAAAAAHVVEVDARDIRAGDVPVTVDAQKLALQELQPAGVQPLLPQAPRRMQQVQVGPVGQRVRLAVQAVAGLQQRHVEGAAVIGHQVLEPAEVLGQAAQQGASSG